MEQTKLKSNFAEVAGGTSTNANDITAAKDELKKYQSYLLRRARNDRGTITVPDRSNRLQSRVT